MLIRSWARWRDGYLKIEEEVRLRAVRVLLVPGAASFTEWATVNSPHISGVKLSAFQLYFAKRSYQIQERGLRDLEGRGL
jgi:hypothetical protein